MGPQGVTVRRELVAAQPRVGTSGAQPFVAMVPHTIASSERTWLRVSSVARISRPAGLARFSTRPTIPDGAGVAMPER